MPIQIQETKKACISCGEMLNISEFYSRKKNGKFYTCSYCKACDKNIRKRNRQIQKNDDRDVILEFSLYLKSLGVSLLKIVREINEEREGYVM